MGLILGLDLDNTLIQYDHVFRVAAEDAGWIPEGSDLTKVEIRNAVRALPDGETCWQKLQAQVYGPRIQQASVSPGAKAVLRSAVRRNIPVFIVSHKRQFATQDHRQAVDLREAATQWLDQQGFFSDLVVRRENVHFEDSRSEKAARVSALRCTTFVDDLIETFNEPLFPPISRILYSEEAPVDAVNFEHHCRHWDEIAKVIFSD